MSTNTYVPIATTTVPSSVSTVTLNIASFQNYTDLQIVCNVTKGESGSTDMYMQFNGDTGAHYSWTAGSGYSGGTISPTRQVNQGNIYVGWYASLSASAPGIKDISIFNYSATNMYKTVYCRAGLGTGGSDMIQGLWRGVTGSSQEAITSVTFGAISGTIAAGSVFTIYGIANTIALGTKANGGIVYQDTNYWYHVFNASGVFTPTQSLSADILVVAGGGGSGSGGAGAGALLSFSSQSLTATNYTCTVGAGGSAGNFASSVRGANGGSSQFGALTATTGGGGGGMRESQGAGASGGNGGGGAQSSVSIQSGGSGTQGYNGSSGGSTTYGYPSGGGGGAGGAAPSATSTNSAAGGVGVTSTLIDTMGAATNNGEYIASTAHWYFAGGGGGAINGAVVGTNGLGGYGGGGTGGVSATGLPGKANTGGGAGGAGNGNNGSAGGSGVIIIRYAR